MVERLRDALGATDEEWKAIRPLVAKVMEKQTGRLGGMFGGGMRMGFMGPPPGGPPPGGPGAEPGGPPPPGPGDRQRPGAEGERGGPRGDRPRLGGPPNPEVEALAKALEAKDTPAADIEAKLKAVREARKKAEDELKAAREDLRKVLTVRQEAVMVLMGMLD